VVPCLRLDSLGFSSSGYDDSISTSDSTNWTLRSQQPVLYQGFFTHPGTGMAVQLDSYLDGVIGDNGTLVAHQDSLTKQSTNIDTQSATTKSTSPLTRTV